CEAGSRSHPLDIGRFRRRGRRGIPTTAQRGHGRAGGRGAGGRWSSATTEKQGMGETLAGAWNCGAAARGAGRAATEGGLGVEPFGAAVMEREGGSGPRAPSGASGTRPSRSDGAGPAHARGPPGPR
ncbi:unnamed protein product, partial [Prorocentrum cordatum]